MKNQVMGSDHHLQISSPTLPIFSFPIKNHESPGMVTPPLHAAVSVPFEWEEAPGKPRAAGWSRVDKAKSAARCLELPPMMKMSDVVCSPTTVLEGPYVGRSSSFGNDGGKSDGVKEKAGFGSSRWRSSKEDGGRNVQETGHGRRHNDEGDGDTKVKITRMTRRKSFLAMSSKTSHVWTNICESFKQVLPWKQKSRKRLGKMKSTPTTRQ